MDDEARRRVRLLVEIADDMLARGNDRAAQSAVTLGWAIIEAAIARAHPARETGETGRKTGQPGQGRRQEGGQGS